MRANARTDVGCVRSVNQDSVYCSTTPVGPFPNLFIVADGMGGHQAGDYASRYAIESFLEYSKKAEGEPLLRVVDGAIQYANKHVVEKAATDPGLAGMGTTFVVAYIEDNLLYVANVGDSRLYLISDEINQVTEDHSFVAAMMRAGELTREEARNHPEKNVITRAVGVAKGVKADFFEVELRPEDKILMCSDGLSNMVEDDLMYELIVSNDPNVSVDLLVEEARKNGGYDNITALVIDAEVKEADEEC